MTPVKDTACIAAAHSFSVLCKTACGIGNCFCSSLVIITWHLIASVAFKALVSTPENREL